MFFKYVFALSLMAQAYGKGDPDRPLQSAAELLVNKKWVMMSYGFDENGNGLVDLMEERIEDCEKDDTYEFFAGGVGVMSDNSFSCCNGIDEQRFHWQFCNNGQDLLIFSDTINIDRLTTRELITHKKLSYAGGPALNLITVYKALQ